LIIQLKRDGVRKLLNLYGRYSLILFIVFLSSILDAGSFENFQPTREIAFVGSNDKDDSDFIKKLKTNWISYRVVKSESLYERAKPKALSSVTSRRDRAKGPRIGFDIEANDEDSNLTKKPVKAEIKKLKEKDVYVDFFGTELAFNIPNGLKDASYQPRNQKGIVNFFVVSSASDYTQISEYILEVSKELNLNDWGIYLLTDKISKEIFTNIDEANLFDLLIFNKLKYRTRVGISNKKIYIFFHMNEIIYDTPNCRIDGKNYYSFSNSTTITNISTYNDDYHDANNSFNLSLESLPKFKKDIRTKELSFSEYGKKYTIKYRYNQNLLDFMSRYPQANEEVFLNAPMDQMSLRDIAFSMKKNLNNVQASETINFLLHFVQDAFKYEIDSIQFSKQKMMFAQETLYYDKSDAEDRVVLFSYLVKKLLNINTLGIKYANHYTSAIQIPISGDSINYLNKKFIIADPSYKGANIGKGIAKYRSKQPLKIVAVLKKDI